MLDDLFSFLSCFYPQRYKETHSPKDREPLCAADSPGPPTEPFSSSSGENPSSHDTGVVTSVNSVQSTLALSELKEKQRAEDEAEPEAAAQDLSGSTEQELPSREDETAPSLAGGQEAPLEPPAGSTEEPEPGAAVEDDEDEEEGKEVPAVPGKNKKARATPKRRSGRVTNRR